jgi:adenosylcobinamide-phosphate synthase
MAQSDDYAITRIGIAMLLKGFDKGLVAPIIWYLLTGLVGVYLYAGLSALSWRFGKEGFSRGFGAAPLALERLMGFVPNVFSGVLIWLANILTPTASLSRGLKGLMSAKARAPYAQGGAPITAASWGLNISIGGPSTDVEGSAIKRDWIGAPKATAQLQAKHLHRVSYLMFMSLILFAFSIVGGMVFASLNLTEGVELDFIPKIGASVLDFIGQIRLMFAQN